MTDEAIKAALRAGVEGYDAARMAAHGEKYGMSDRNKETITPMIAAAIEAFLRALPEEGKDTWWDNIPFTEETRLWIAAAVARAAQEGGR